MVIPAGAPTSYLLTGFLHALHLTSMENTVLENTDTGGYNMNMVSTYHTLMMDIT